MNPSTADQPETDGRRRAGRRGPDRGGLDRRHVRRLLMLMPHARRALGAVAVGGAASRAVRCAGLPLRQPQADVPQAARAGGAWSAASADAARRPVGARRRRRARGPARRRTSRRCAAWPTTDMIRPRAEAQHDDRGAPGMRLGRAVRARPGRPDLPDLGADLRLQPGVRALPVVVSGRRDPRELTTEQCEAVIDELQRMQVFYVNIGGGEPTIRPDFWHLLRVRRRPPGRREVLHQRRPDHPGAGARSCASHRLRRRADLARRRDRRGQRLRARPGLLRHGDHGAAEPAGRRVQGRQDLASSAPGRTSASSTSSRRSPTSTARRCG